MTPELGRPKESSTLSPEALSSCSMRSLRRSSSLLTQLMKCTIGIVITVVITVISTRTA